MEMVVKVSVVLPAYNEAKFIEKAVEEVRKELSRHFNDGEYEIIIAEDGSTDGTDRIAKTLEDKYPDVRHIHSDERLGRGRALKNAFRSAQGEILVYLDVDLSTDMKHLRELIDAIEKGYDFATGSRLLNESDADRPLKRNFASKGYNFLVRLFLGSKLRDHQCGFKAFRKKALFEFIDEVKDNHWFWDTEVMVLAQKRGYRVYEFPVRWKQGKETKVSFGKDIAYMFSQILRMWSEDLKERRSRKFLFMSVMLAMAILIALTLYIGVQSVVETILSANPLIIGVASLFYALSFLLRGWRFSYIIRQLNFQVPVIFSTESVAISQTLNVITPVRIGDLGRAYVFRKREVPYSISFSGLAVERIFDLISILILAFISILLISGTQFLRTPLYATVFLVIIIAGFIVLSRMQNMVGQIIRDANRVMKAKSSPVIFLSSVLLWLFDITVCYMILGSFGYSNLFLLSIIAVSVGNITKVLPVTPGGIGTYEAVLTGILSTTVEPSIAFSVALLDHAIKNIITVFLGGLSLASLNIKLKEISK
jgi:hypothetical protein